jgi:hypothetical protein
MGKERGKTNMALNAVSHAATTGIVALGTKALDYVPAAITSPVNDLTKSVKEAAAEHFGEQNVANAADVLAWVGKAFAYNATKNALENAVVGSLAFAVSKSGSGSNSSSH